MDIKSMLTAEAGVQRASLPPGPPHISTGSHTPQSSFDGRMDYTPISDVTSARPTFHGAALQSADSRGGSAGGYFQNHSHSQSPYPIPSAASTPSGGPSSAWAQSPGGQSQTGMYRDSMPPAPHTTHGVFVSPQPPTPGSAHAHQQSGYPSNSVYQQQHGLQHYQQQYQQLQSQQLQSSPPTTSHVLTRQISPSSQFQGHPATPLGPPIGYPKVSPYRPPSQGAPDHLRRASQSSISSIISHTQYTAPTADHIGRESTSFSHPLPDFPDRDRSVSVSPKTIPRPPPLRGHSTGSQSHSHSHSSLPHHSDSRSSQPPHPDARRLSHHPSFDYQAELGPSQTTPARSISSLPDQRQSSHDRAIHSSPAPAATDRSIMTKRIKEEDLHPHPVQSLKRSASHLSDTTRAVVKRSRHDRPRWAESARKGRPLNLKHEPTTQNHRVQRPQRPAPAPRHDSIRPQPVQQNGSIPPQPHNTTGKAPFEGTISDILPMPSLLRSVCNWIATTIGNQQPPPDSMFELEAKIGHILSDGKRIYLPIVDSEVLLNTDGTTYRFKSEMSLDQHRHINEQLNRWTVASHNAYAKDNRTYRITSDHPKENDEFFELTEEGRQRLHPEVLAYINDTSNLANTDRNGRKQVRVRRSVNKTTGQISRQLIKTRIANREIHNPDLDFDYRISISLETGWHGEDAWLRPLNDTRGRNKDRMSYQHRYFHVDLTQVTHAESSRVEHELEVEVNAGVLEGELTKLRSRDPESKFQMVIEDLLNNTRVLCREGGPRMN